MPDALTAFALPKIDTCASCGKDACFCRMCRAAKNEKPLCSKCLRAEGERAKLAAAISASSSNQPAAGPQTLPPAS